MQTWENAKMSRAILSALILLSAGLPSAVAAAQDNPPPKELVQYVRDAKKAGLDERQIQQNAVSAGWPAGVVTDAISTSTEKKEPEKAPAKAPEKPSAPVADSKVVQPAPKTLPPADVKPVEQPAGSVAPVQAGIGGVTTAGVGAAGVGGTNPAVKPTQPINRGVAEDYQIGPGDVLHVSVWGEPTASVNGAIVRTDGKISLPLIHDIFVMGLTTSQAEKTIAEQLGRFVNNPDVAVIVGAINSKKIYVTGQVKKEG